MKNSLRLLLVIVALFVASALGDGLLGNLVDGLIKPPGSDTKSDDNSKGGGLLDGLLKGGVGSLKTLLSSGVLENLLTEVRTLGTTMPSLLTSIGGVAEKLPILVKAIPILVKGLPVSIEFFFRFFIFNTNLFRINYIHFYRNKYRKLPNNCQL